MEGSSLAELYEDREATQAAADYIDMAGGWQEPGPPGPLDLYPLDQEAPA